MFLTLNNKIKNGKSIFIFNNNVKVENAFITINTFLEEEQLKIEKNNIVFSGKSEFIIDNNNPKLNVYANMENAEKPRNTELKDGEVELFVDNNKNLNYINNNEEIKFLKQGVIER